MERIFAPETARWFRDALGEPTAVQREAWPLIAAGEHVLVSAPTGTGKTLAAFLVLIDRLKAMAARGDLPDGVQVVYISPLKSLATDIRENLTRPLEGIGGAGLRVGLRTGDTPAAERQRMLRRPPHILIITPESLYLLLTTAKGRRMLGGVRAVIVDELHALISGKRGAHLMLSLARLDALTDRPVQRIGLSATIRPLELAAEYLAPDSGARIVAPPMRKRADMAVEGVLPDMRSLPEGSIWPELAQRVFERCQGARTVIAFLEGRAQAERLAAAVNDIAGEGFALAHHGSVSRQKRQEAEEALRSGRLRLLCATSSMELGIDVGDVDLVLQVGCPLTVSSALQRMGRAGHHPGRESVMRIYPKTASDGLYCALTADAAMEGCIEPARPPEGCLDVLAQHLVSMAADGGYTVDQALDIARRAWPTRNATREEIESLLEMLSGDWEHAQDRPARARLLYDRINGAVTGDGYTRLLALSAGGTIPDRGLYPALLRDGTRVGELDEEFVFEARIGDRFLLGAFAWRIEEIGRDRVIVSQAGGAGAQPPFWRGDGVGRDYGVSLRFGSRLRRLGEAKDARAALETLRMDANAADNAARFVRQQLKSTGCLPDDRTIILEHFADQDGENQLMVHSIFGRRVNDALAMLLQQAAARALDTDVRAYDDDNGVLLYTMGTRPVPDSLLRALDPARCEAVLRAVLPATPLFAMAFRYNAGRALMMGSRNGRRQALWVQRVRGAEALGIAVRDPNHPLMRETLRECLRDYLDINALTEVLEGVRSGVIAVRELHLNEPSPMSLPMRRQVEAEMMYDYSPIPGAANKASQEALDEVLREGGAIAPSPDALASQAMRRRKPENADQLHSLLMAEGDFAAGEIDAPIEWLEALHRAGRCLYIEPGLWIAAEQQGEYLRAERDGDAQARSRIALRCLRYRGPQDEMSLAERYSWPGEGCRAVLNSLLRAGSAVCDAGLYHHAELYERARRQTLMERRRTVETAPPERLAAMAARALRVPGRPADQLREAVEALLDRPFPLRHWESQLLPARVNGYRPALLDALLAEGDYLWQLCPEGLSFHRAEDADWDAMPLARTADQPLSGDAAALVDALERRGASFPAALSGLTRDRPAIDGLLELASRGLARSDSFAALRAMMALEAVGAQPSRRLSQLRAQASRAGRWELTRPMRQRDDEELLLADFRQRRLICRETVMRLPWARALEKLRVWEYTGRARRGYFVSGLSGIQFVLSEDFDAVTAALNAHDEGLAWLHANDPAQLWGGTLPHGEGRAFACLPGSVVCLADGMPVAVLEQGGKRLRLFRPELAEATLRALAADFARGRVYADRERLLLREGTRGLEEALARAGWAREALDWTLWRQA